MRNRPYFKVYLFITLWLTVILLPFGILGTFFGIREIITQSTLLIFSSLDVLLILIYLKKVSFTKLELILIFLILLSIPIGLIHANTYDRRLLTDLINPLFFILKCSIFRKLFSDDNNQTLLDTFVAQFIKASFYLAVCSIIIYYILTRFRPMYAGITPITHPFFISSLLKGNLIGQLASIVVVLFSGKRALLISSIVIFLIYRVYIQKKVKGIILLVFVFFGVGLTAIWVSNNTTSIAAINKYKWTYEKFSESDIELSLDDETGVIDLLTGGRLAEVQGALKVMEPVDYWFGRGIGFTYTFSSPIYDKEVKGYSNLHFTPLSIITKYGCVFFVFFLSYIFYNMRGFRKKGFLGIFFGLYLIGLLIDMLFAYVIFVDPIIPIAIGILSVKIQDKI